MGVEYRANVSRTLEILAKTLLMRIWEISTRLHTLIQQSTRLQLQVSLFQKYFCAYKKAMICLDHECRRRLIIFVKNSKMSMSPVQDPENWHQRYFQTIYKMCYNLTCKITTFFLFWIAGEGKKNDKLFEIFQNEAGESFCPRHVIPPGCTPLCQPLDVYMHRQIKWFVKELQNSTYLMQKNLQINTRNDAIKIHALILNQLSAPIFQPMLEYSWFASKLINDRDLFGNVKEVCFTNIIKKQLSSISPYQNNSFIMCSWCREVLCFHCFYNLYHPKHCTNYFRNL